MSKPLATTLFRFIPVLSFIVSILITAMTAPAQAQQEGQNCKRAIVDRLNLGIGLYRMEIAASHLVDQYQTAKTAERRSQLDKAKQSLSDLNSTLLNRLAQVSATKDANGRCAETPHLIPPINQALNAYNQVVQSRRHFMRNRLALLKSSPAGQALAWNPEEANLWVQEPRARYDVWRTIARALPQHTETSSALFVLGMLTRVEWHTAMAMHTGLTSGADPQITRQHLLNAINDTKALQNNWPTPPGKANNTLWTNLQAITRATPSAGSTEIPKAAPAQGWAAWIGKWLEGYSKTFMHAIPKVLASLEDVAAK